MLCQLLIKRLELRHHFQCRLTGVIGVLRVVKRRVPERHDSIAHVLIDRSAVVQNSLAEGRQELVDKTCKLGRAELLGDGCEIPDITEHERKLAHFTTQFELLRIGDNFFDDLGRKIMAECRADSSALCLGPPVHIKCQRCRHATQRQGRIGCVDEQSPYAKR